MSEIMLLGKYNAYLERLTQALDDCPTEFVGVTVDIDRAIRRGKKLRDEIVASVPTFNSKNIELTQDEILILIESTTGLKFDISPNELSYRDYQKLETASGGISPSNGVIHSYYLQTSKGVSFMDAQNGEIEGIHVATTTGLFIIRCVFVKDHKHVYKNSAVLYNETAINSVHDFLQLRSVYA